MGDFDSYYAALGKPPSELQKEWKEYIRVVLDSMVVRSRQTLDVMIGLNLYVERFTLPMFCFPVASIPRKSPLHAPFGPENLVLGSYRETLTIFVSSGSIFTPPYNVHWLANFRNRNLIKLTRTCANMDATRV